MEVNYPPLGLVLPDKRTRGVNQPDDDPTFHGPVESSGQILYREYGGDAHFVCYYPRTESERESYPRCNKPILDYIRQQGDDLVAGWLVYDLDNKGHVEHASAEAARELVHKLAEMEPKPHCVYSTRHGARIMFALEHPVPVDVLEEMLPGFAETLTVDVDHAAFDWTRLFRVPKATRDNIQQWTRPWFLMQLDRTEHPLYKIADIPRKRIDRSGAKRIRHLNRDYGDQPTIEESMDLLYSIQDEYPLVLAELGRRARNRVCDPVLFGNTEVAPANGPGRMNALQRYVGDACAWFYPAAGSGCTPQLVHAMFIERGVCNFLPDMDTPDWVAELWITVCRYWRYEEEKDPDPEATKRGPVDVKAEGQMTQISRMSNGVAQWADGFPARTNPEDRQRWIQEHLIAVGPKGELHLIGKDGYITNTILDKTSLIPAIRDHGLDQVIEMDEMSPQGHLRPRSVDSIIRACGTHFGEKRMMSGIVDAEGKPSGRLIGMGSDSTRLDFSTFARKDLEPAFDPDVAEWLQAFAGKHYDQLQRWIAWALAFEEGPICALGLYGPPGVGKKLLTRGLAECITTEEFGTGDDFKTWGYGLVRSPWLFVNEGFPAGAQANTLADTFRKFVDGERIRVELKFQAPFMICNPLRIVLLSNNMDLISQLAGNRDLSPEDRAAIEQRIIVFETSNDARKMLIAKGGITHTRGWVGGDDGAPGDNRIARHFLQLYANRHQFARDSRFLVEGKQNPQLEEILLFSSGATPTIVEAIINAVENGQPSQIGVQIDNGDLWITSDAIVMQVRKDSKKVSGQKPFSHNLVGRIVRGLVKPGGHSVLKQFKNRRTKWHLIDLARLESFANQFGLEHKRLDTIIAGGEVEPAHIALLTRKKA